MLFPAVKLEERGRPNQAIYDILAANVRHPAQNRGDLRAQLAAARSGDRRLRRLAELHGSEVLIETGAALIAYSAARTREAIAEMPDGTYVAEGWLDDDGLTPGVPVAIRVAVTVEGEQMTVDFGGSDPQMPGGMNCPLATTRSVVHYGVRCLMTGDVPFNEGSVEPVEIVAPEGTVVNPRYPAAVGDRHHTSQRMADVLTRALATIRPERGSAGWFCGVPATIVEATSNRTGEASVLLSLIGGGAGAAPTHDGADAVEAHMSNCSLLAAEIIESTYPLRVERYELVPDSGGAGRCRGGLGMRFDFRVLAEEAVPVRVETEQAAPALGAPGFAGGQPGRPAAVVLIREGEEIVQAPKGVVDARAGDVVSVRAGGGGGYGDPRDRPPDELAADVRAGRVSEAAARDVYGGGS